MDADVDRSAVAFRLQPAQSIQGATVPRGLTACELFWDIDPAPVDGGLDQRVIGCLSEVFCAFGTFAFISDKFDANESFVQRIKARLWPPRSASIQEKKSVFRQLHLPKVRSGALRLVETDQASVAQEFFRIQAWHYTRCQVGYLRDVGSPPLNLSDREIQDVIVGGSWDVMQHFLRASGSKAVCVPGHDGAWLKFVFLNVQTMRGFSEQLRACCAGRQAACVIGV